MASEFEELCSIYGLDPSDSDSIDRLIFLINREDDSDDEDFYGDQGFFIDEDEFPDDPGEE